MLKIEDEKILGRNHRAVLRRGVRGMQAKDAKGVRSYLRRALYALAFTADSFGSTSSRSADS